jgi:hypothetical protein
VKNAKSANNANNAKNASVCVEAFYNGRSEMSNENSQTKPNHDFLTTYRRFAAEKAAGAEDWHFARRPIGTTGPWRVVAVQHAEGAADLLSRAAERGEEIRRATPQEIEAYRGAGQPGTGGRS